MSYIERERTMSPASPSTTTTARPPSRPSLSPLRQRTLRRASTFSDTNLRRTSSLTSNFSDSVNDASQSIKSTTDDLFLPRAKSPDVLTGHEPSHWHSVPLALALLPALGGLLFEKGSAVVTDVTLLGLAAVLLNWSVRLPWDWYHTAQAIAIAADEEEENLSPDAEDDYPPPSPSHSAIPEEQEESDEQPPHPSQPSPPTTSPPQYHASARRELRLHALLALSTCFLGPLTGAWLLHHIRTQLSRPSEGLVSNYNLTIFLLAAELRPLSHLIKLVQARTLHLQRVVGVNPYLPSSHSGGVGGGVGGEDLGEIKELTTRITDLEAHITNANSPNNPVKQLPEITALVRHSLQPDLDALNRAVRRYEKRSVLLSMQTEKRLQDLEARMGDAITLAAAAERRGMAKGAGGWGLGSIWGVAEGLAGVVLLPVRVAVGVLAVPGRVVGMLEGVVGGAIGGVVAKELKTAGKGGGSASASEREKGVRRGGMVGSGRAGKKAM